MLLSFFPLFSFSHFFNGRVIFIVFPPCCRVLHAIPPNEAIDTVEVSYFVSIILFLVFLSAQRRDRDKTYKYPVAAR